MEHPASGAVPRSLLGILFMMLATSLFPVMNGVVKILSADYPTEQIIWARTASHMVFVLLLFGPGIGWRIFRSVRLKAQIGRSLVLLGSTTCFFSGVKFMPLAEASSVSFASPFIVALLAVPLLGEKLSLVRLAAVAVGFLGVLGGLGHYCVARALTYGTAGVVSPFHYWQIVGAVTTGYLLFGDLPDVYTWTGAALIVASGLFIGWRETREHAPVKIASP